MKWNISGKGYLVLEHQVLYQTMEYVNILTALIVVLLAIVLYIKKVCYTYWKRRGVPYIEPEFFYGTARRSIKGESPFGLDVADFYKEFRRRGLKHGGAYVFLSAVYIPTDPELIKSILQRDFDHFVNRGMYVNEEVDPLSGHLFNLEDTRWKNLRAKLTPTFTSGKMKMMFQTLVACSDELERILNDHSVIQDVVDIKELLTCFTTDIIGSCAFGLDCNSLKDPNSEFRVIGRRMFDPTRASSFKRLIRMLVPFSVLKLFGIRIMSKWLDDFFTKIVTETMEYREKNNVSRKDFMHLLLELKNKGIVSDGDDIGDVKVNNEKHTNFLTTNEITAQCFVFFVAGFETSSTTMTFALYELAVNQEIQDKLRNEIRSVLKRHENKLTYESIMEMTYLDKVVNETLRLRSPALTLNRVCNKPYAVPDTDVVLEKGTRVLISIYGIHRDPKYYPNPEVFDPERFSEVNKAKRPTSAFIPFGDGPRICIGLRFGILQSKVGLVRILENYRVTLNKKTKTPIELDPRGLVATPKGGVWLNVAKVN